jgi:pheromone shutdown protein TraB
MDNILSKNIIKEWGLESLSPEKQAEMIDRIGKMAYQAVLVRALDILSEKEQTEFDLLLDEDTTTPQEVLAFLQSKIPTFEQLVLEERNNLKRDLLIPVL